MMDRSAVICNEPLGGVEKVGASADGTRSVPATMAGGAGEHSCHIGGACVVLLTALLAAPGCRGDYPPTVPVRGQVTYDGGPWPAEGTIYFLPEKAAEGHTHHAGMASFGRDGSFTAGTFSSGDGLAPGTYVVRIECWKVPPAMGGPPPESYLPSAYQTGRKMLPKLVVEPGARRVRYEYDVSASGTGASAAAAARRWPAARHLPRRGAVHPGGGNALSHAFRLTCYRSHHDLC